ncbi:MAG: CocE/NonD family hydrolase, partial [Chloroflexi bacterium]|nr:CocE/NonD family hydrolase [Chloroflexota bacterium]
TDATDATGQDDYVVDYTTTSGTATRWMAGYSGPFGYPDMTANDEKALTYTTPPLEVDTELTGHPVVHLWVTSSADDGDFFVYLEEVESDGTATYLTEGVLRASHRQLSEPPFEYMGLPFQRSYAADLMPLPAGEPVELVFDLQPTSNVFDAGNRIRITVTGADADNYRTPELDPPPTVSIYRSAEYTSYIVLPVIPAE